MLTNDLADARAVYTGLAIGGASASAPFLYAANIAQGRIDVFDGTFTNVTNTTFAGKFVDPALRRGSSRSMCRQLAALAATST